MQRWWLLGILLVIAIAKVHAEEGFIFPDMRAVIITKDDKGFIFAPPQGYEVDELDTEHNFSIIYRLINDNGVQAIELAIDEADVLYELEVLASEQSFYLFIGDHWLSDGENTTILSKQDYAEFIRVFNSRDGEGLEDSQSLQSFVSAYEQNWEPSVVGENNQQNSIENSDSEADSLKVNSIATIAQSTEPRTDDNAHSKQAIAQQPELAVDENEDGRERVAEEEPTDNTEEVLSEMDDTVSNIELINETSVVVSSVSSPRDDKSSIGVLLTKKQELQNTASLVDTAFAKVELNEKNDSSLGGSVIEISESELGVWKTLLFGLLTAVLVVLAVLGIKRLRL